MYNCFVFMKSCLGCCIVASNNVHLLQNNSRRTVFEIMVNIKKIIKFPGAFLLPYLIFMILCAIPLFFLEMAYAQFSNLGPGKAWICVPLLRGNFLINTMFGINMQFALATYCDVFQIRRVSYAVRTY